MPGVAMRARLAEHKRVPQCQERPGQGGDHHGVVNVGDDAEARVRSDHLDQRLHRFGPFGLQDCGVPAGGKPDVHHRVDQAAAVCLDAGHDVADGDFDVGELQRERW